MASRIIEGPERFDRVAERLRGLLQRLMSRRDIPHVILAVESEDGRFRWCETAGDAAPDGTPMRRDTPFHTASIDKLYTATVVMKLRERGQIDLDEPLGAYLPQTLIRGLHRIGGIDHTDAVTIRHLLSHTSGLADYLEERPKGGQSLMERLLAGGDMAWGIEEIVRIVRDDLPPHFPPQPADAPRQRARYSDTNFQLLNAIIEAVTAQSFHRAFEEMVFRPLKLHHTHVYGLAKPLAPTAEPAVVWAGNRPLNLPLALQSFPSVYSTVGDCLAFLRALVSGTVFDDAATYASMQSRWNRFGLPLDAAALRAPGWPIEYGLGLMRFRLPRWLTPLRPLPAVIGHTGSTGCWLFHCPSLALLLCGTVDQATAGAVPYRVVPRMLRIARDAARDANG